MKILSSPQIVSSAQKSAPSILYLPNLNLLQTSCNVSVCNVIHSMVYDTPPDTKMLVIATTSESEALVRKGEQRKCSNVWYDKS